VIKIKKELIHKAKVKKSYAKLLTQEPPTPSTISEPLAEPSSQELHPSRKAMLFALQESTPPSQSSQYPHRERRQRKPKYFEKEEAYAAERKAEANSRREAYERREKEKQEKIEERDRFRKAMAKARSGGKNGQRKLGRESKVLLEKVKRVVGS
jgi:hypothetical protein